MLNTKNTNALLSTIYAITVIYCAFVIMACERKIPFDTKKSLATKPGYDVLGDWEKKYPFSLTNISILPNGRFKYKHQGCLGTLHTEGSWTWNASNEIVLQSDSSYHTDARALAIANSQTEEVSFPFNDSNALAAFFGSYESNAFRSDARKIYFSGKKLLFRDGKIVDIPFETKDTVWEYRKVGGNTLHFKNIDSR